ncbi:MAG: hypothetical protein OEQ49_12475 [Myxococcales bacterium]|nr:hypothetical protein [Myxococcales bacterium]
MSRDAQITHCASGEPLVERELYAGLAYIDGRRHLLDRRQDLYLGI